MIPIARPSIGDDELDAVADVLRSGQLVQGARVDAFEQACARYLSVEHAVAVSSCTAALHLAVLALDLPQRARVAVPAFSWPATANAVVLAGATPVFVDIERGTLAADPAIVEELLEEIDAIVTVHAFGRLASVRRLAHLADRAGVPLIEDAACAFGTRSDGTDAGRFGRVGCFSFHPRKALTTGEGGLLVTADGELAGRLRSLRNHGLDDSGQFTMPGFNYRMTELQAALGCVQVARFPELLANRRALARRYEHLLEALPVETPDLGAAEEHSIQSYVVLLPPDVGDRRAQIIDLMAGGGVATTIGTIHIPLTPYFSSQGGFEVGDFPVTDDIAARALTLPVYEGMSDVDQEKVVEVLRDAIARVRRDGG